MVEHERADAGTGTTADDAPIWTATPERRRASALARFTDWIARVDGRRFETYDELWRWSTDELEQFWGSVQRYFDVGRGDAEVVLRERTMPGAEWFPGLRLNYAEECLRRAPQEGPALIAYREDAEPDEITASELRDQVGALARTLRELGVGPGDRVAALLPNVPQAVVGLLATASIGAIWTACAPDFGTQSVLDRFTQVAPKVVIAVDHYRFNGRRHERREVVDALAALPTVETVILVGGGRGPAGAHGLAWDEATATPAEVRFADLPFHHPLWILFSSGTTGTPKGIVHSHGGIVLEHLKSISLGSDVRAGDRFYFFSSTSWMVWNWLVGGLLVGATPVLYDGSPGYGGVDTSWRIAAHSRANIFGTGAAYLSACERQGVRPGTTLDLSRLRSVISTGSPLPPTTWRWVGDAVSADVRIDSSCGGTDVCGAILSGSPWLDVHVGELSGPCLGVRAEAFDDAGVAVRGAVGELVVRDPMPSMPVRFWNDPDGDRYRAAYFEKFPGVWSQGDWVEFTAHGGAKVTGRSDATLNKAGVRMGSADIYSIVDPIEGVTDSLVLGIELPDGGYLMPLFVALEEDHAIDDVRERIEAAIRRDLSPRHMPDQIVDVPAIPRTLTGKRLEVPVKRILLGQAGPESVARGSISDPQMLDWFVDFRERHVRPRLVAS